ncbi:MAG: prepilin-type N-terminal cleavage/methylation domain-containing protein, partial [Deltaproteobacteria bacterium]|nr:prepilin-type N-terminal cleavage/methylation domain-containing protein [Deltaproteobacteria bacterium]
MGDACRESTGGQVREKGFTLIEVLIAITLLAIISLLL